MAIVVSWLAVLPVLASSGVLPWPVFWALLGAGALVALIGFVDDHSHVPAFWRLVAHFAAAAWLLHGLHGMPPLTLLGGTIPNGWLLQLLAAVYVVWLLNLYNFMDGIDGIASVETITVCMSGALLYLLLDAPVFGAPPLLLAAAVAGFLYWNFPPARIFLGDAGSGFLGVLLAGFSIQAAWVAPELFWSWMVLLGVFIVDATFTLLRRLFRGEPVYEAHRSHAYQRASRRLGRHLPVTLAVGMINLFWLLPIAVCVAVGSLEGGLGVSLAYAPLLALAWMLDAGRREPESGLTP